MDGENIVYIYIGFIVFIAGFNVAQTVSRSFTEGSWFYRRLSEDEKHPAMYDCWYF